MVQWPEGEYLVTEFRSGRMHVIGRFRPKLERGHIGEQAKRRFQMIQEKHPDAMLWVRAIHVEGK